MKTQRKPLETHPVLNRSSFGEAVRSFWYGSAPKPVKKRPISGLINQTTRCRITRHVKEVVATAKWFKIGVTGDTLARMDKVDYRQEYERVARVYKTASKEAAINLEVELIKKFQKLYPDRIANTSTSRAGRLTTYNGYYFVYIVFKE